MVTATIAPLRNAPGPAGPPNGPPVNVHTSSGSAPAVKTAAAASGKNALGSTLTSRRQYSRASR